MGGLTAEEEDQVMETSTQEATDLRSEPPTAATSAAHKPARKHKEPRPELKVPDKAKRSEIFSECTSTHTVKPVPKFLDLLSGTKRAKN